MAGIRRCCYAERDLAIDRSRCSATGGGGQGVVEDNYSWHPQVLLELPLKRDVRSKEQVSIKRGIWPVVTFILLLILSVLWSTPVVARPATPWSRVVQPATGDPRVVGSYTSGCLQGAQALPAVGQGFQSMRRSHRRYFGHPVLIHYLQALGQRVDAEGLGVLSIGDLGQARGGPIPSSHRSHQVGLDADVWFWLPEPAQTLPAAQRETVSALSMLTADRQALHPKFWTSRQARLLQLAASSEAVERIFVHARIKQGLCKMSAGAPWLRKIRPWWGHHYHFHVRLRCPSGNAACVSQDPPPAGDGCGTSLAWWFSEEAQRPRPPSGKKEVKRRLPAACQAILKQ